MASLLLLVAALCAVTVAGNLETNMVGDRQVVVNLFAWKWTDIAEECERYLGPMGFGGVTISPPNEHAVIANQKPPWWERYLPVSYKLQSRSGTEQDLRDMVKRCNKAGVRIYADAVINHMTNGGMSEGSAGSPYDPETLSYPEVPYAARDFNVHNKKCPTKSGDIGDSKDVKVIRNCNLFGLPDLDMSVYHVKYSIASYMNRLIDMGVAGFRISNAENIWPDDLKSIYGSLDNLNTEFFPPGSRPFIFQDVQPVDVKLGEVKPFTLDEYTGIGRVTEYEYGVTLTSAIRGSNTTLARLRSLEKDLSVPSPGALVFVENHKTQRQTSGVISVKEHRLYAAANAFMLAHPYGVAQVMSGFNFSSFNDGPPTNADGKLVSPVIDDEGLCTNGWLCEHRRREIKNMVAFRNAAAGQLLTNWWSNGNQQIAFGRGDKAFIVINNEQVTLSKLLYTGLTKGVYCNIISGDFDQQSTLCTGPVITVDESGYAQFTLKTDASPVVAIHVNAMMKADEQIQPSPSPSSSRPDEAPTVNTRFPITPPPTPPPVLPSVQQSQTSTVNPPSQSPTTQKPSTDTSNPSTHVSKATWRRTTIFIHKETVFGENLFILGGLTNRDGCTDQANTSACAIPISHITPGDNTQYNAWKLGDNYLDWYGAEAGQGSYENTEPRGTPLVWTTNDPSETAHVATDGFGYSPLNVWGSNYWMVDLEMDCARTEDGWFELKAFSMNRHGWESDVYQGVSCQGSAEATTPRATTNHFARCGFINIFKYGEDECTIDAFGHETPATQPTPTIPTQTATSPKSSQDSTSVRPTTTPVVNPAAKRTIIFIRKSLGFGEYLFIRGGIDHDRREGCNYNAGASPCALPIVHLIQGDNAAYNAWKTGDNHLDWYGNEDGQQSYQNTASEGTPMVWTTDDPSYTANVATNGYGYTPFNHWGDHYWMVDLLMDCSKTEDGWFELKGFSINGNGGWESEIDQVESCDGSPGGSKPFASRNHYARCGFINVFRFGENSCIIDSLDNSK